MPTPMLTRRSALLVQMESVYDTLPAFSGATDALLCDAPTFAPNMQVLQRKIVHPSLSRLPHKIGYKLGKLSFSAEFNMNDLANTGLANNAPVIGRLLRGCGMARAAHAATWVSGVLPQTVDASETVSFSSSVGGNYAGSPIVYVVTCTTPGSSGVAQLSATPHDSTLDNPQTALGVTNSTPIAIGTKGATITPTVALPLIAGQQWLVAIFPPGLMYSPISTTFESVGFQFFLDGSLHQLSGAYGTFVLKANAGQIPMIDFTFDGRYIDYLDQAFPTVTYPLGAVPVFESAGLALGSFPPVVDAMTIDIGNTVTPRSSANTSDGYLGMMITARDAKGGVDPESNNVSSQNFWSALSNAKSVPLCARIGQVVGSRMFVFAPNGQYSGLTYKDRNGVRAHDAAIAFNQVNGDDELFMYCY